LKELEEQYAKEKAATERQFEKQRQVRHYFWWLIVNCSFVDISSYFSITWPLHH